ncbi:adenylate/guanylate cyclase domain-containing protein, partial [Nocardioides sp.]|uniref:adenylate/guanylate cyclase domain-containing protein n=1 Tax=Nocardioides sp. TaxID=35761 RepID=UPI0027327095
MTAPDPAAASPEDGPRASVAEHLERAILGDERVFRAADVAEEAGASLDQARRLWRALGFPEQETEIAFTRADAEAMGTILGAVASGLIDFDTGVNLTRGVGQTMARLADWEVATLVHRIEQLETGSSATGSRSGSALRLVEELNPRFEEMLVYAWRRHLAAAVSRLEGVGARDEDLNTVELTVGFADLVSFTALSNQMDEDRIGDLVEVFESRCHDVVANHRGRVIKSLGDSVLFVNDDAIR